MPRKKRPGMASIYFEAPDALDEKFDVLVASIPLGGKAEHLRLAMQRHLDHPPKLVIPKLAPTHVPK